MNPALLALAGLYAQLSLLAVGGVNSVVPEMQRQVVDLHHWMNANEFAGIFALAQAAPGPNMLVATLVGWRVGGLPGALTATLAMIGPSSLLTWAVAGAWRRFHAAPWRQRIQAGLTPLTAGLVAAAAALLGVSTTHGLATAGITGGAVALMLLTRLHPLWSLGAGALLGTVVLG